MVDTTAHGTDHDNLIDGRYRIVRKIADGGMATVYQTVDERLGRNVAVKIMHMQLAQGPHREQFIERFRREAKSAAAIANPHVVQVYDTGETNGSYYLVMEYVHGVNLRSQMQTHTTFSVRDTLRIVGETLNGLAAAHEIGVVHRDIKPENILINDRGHVEITDFGLAKVASQATLSSTGMLLGTAAYLAPEMIENNQATPQGDCYSVGIMAWELLAGRVPFQSDNPVTMVFKHVNENIPSIGAVCYGIDPQVSAFISYLTARDVNARPKSAQEALDRLRELMPTLSRQALDYRFRPQEPPINSTRVFPMGANEQDSGRPSVPSTSDSPEESTPPPTSAAALFTALASPDLTDDEAEQARTVALATPPDDSSTPGSEVPASGGTTVPPYGGSAGSYGRNSGRPGEPGSPLPSNAQTQVQPRKRHRTALIVSIIAAILALGAGGGFALWYFVGPGSYWTLPKPEGLSCAENAPCKITGVKWDSYERLLKVSQIPYKSTQQYSDTVPAGEIISTDPQYVDAHVSKRANGEVHVTVSQGVQQATVPEDIMSSSTPLEDLREAGFTNITHNEDNDEYSESVPEGEVIDITPSAGTTQNHNDDVGVTLSKGPMPVAMPNVVGMTRGQAQKSFDDAKLKATYTEEYSDTIPRDQVISVDPEAGTQLHWGDAVTVTVSRGPEMVTVPDVTGKKTEEARKILEDLGFEVKVSSPLGDLLHTVRFQDPKGGQQVRLRGEDGKKTVITLTVI